jgi:hypothetical protein
MWQILAQQARDIARERSEEARRNRLATEARSMMARETSLHGLPAAPSRARHATASALRVVSGAFETVSDAACDAATRLDGRTA